MKNESISPIGESVSGHTARKRTDPHYAALAEKFVFANEIATLLIGYRMKHSLTQKQLAERLGLTVPEVSRLEHGRHNPNTRTVERIAYALGKRIAFVDAEPDTVTDSTRELTVV